MREDGKFRKAEVVYCGCNRRHDVKMIENEL